MKFGELLAVINRHQGRHDKIAITIGLGCDGVIEAESPILDYLADYDVRWIAPDTVGNNTITDSAEPCIEIHLAAKEEPTEEDPAE